LSIPAVTAVARYSASVQLDQSPSTKDRIIKSRRVVTDKVDAGISVYGVSTGFGGSGKSLFHIHYSSLINSIPFTPADTRTDDTLALGSALLQLLHNGVLPSSTETLEVLPLLDPLSSSSMPESWVRGAILIRMNSLIRSHSGVRWELIQKMSDLLHANITPLVPLRGSISASGGMPLLIFPRILVTKWSLSFSRSLLPVVHCGHSDWRPLHPRLRWPFKVWGAADCPIFPGIEGAWY
jgi:phenylalanine ammonia-lyase